MIPPEVKDFRGLVRWLAAAKHRGSYYPMAQKLGVSAGLVYQWKDGVVKRPSDDSIERLCQAYALEFWEVMALTRPRRRRPLPISGGCDLLDEAVAATRYYVHFARRRLTEFLNGWYRLTLDPQLGYAT